MNKEQIKVLALEHGFKLKQQPDGSIDLNPYVYEFAKAVFNHMDVVDKQNPPLERCLAYTPGNDDPSITYRIVPARLFKQLATDATLWRPLPSILNSKCVVIEEMIKGDL